MISGPDQQGPDQRGAQQHQQPTLGTLDGFFRKASQFSVSSGHLFSPCARGENRHPKAVDSTGQES